MMGEESKEEIGRVEKKYVKLQRVEIPFSEHIQISKSRRPKPYVKDKCRLPKKYLTEDYDWNAKGFLVRKSDGLVIVSNSKSAGTPRYKRINGQDIYNGNISRQARANLVKLIHTKFSPFLKGINPILDVKSFPLGIHLNFYVVDKGKHNIDNDNKWIWEKAIQDTIVELGVIPDDNPYVVWENIKRTILVSEEKEEKLVIEIYGYA